MLSVERRFILSRATRDNDILYSDVYDISNLHQEITGGSTLK